MFYLPPSTKEARKNIKLLEKADKLAITKIKNPKNQKYKNVLKKQEDQLQYYLSTYTDPDYLPKAIAKEYEFPKYFHYTVNKRDGTIQNKRSRIDSKTFKKFMDNPEKRRQAKEQGLFKITKEPIIITHNEKSITPKKQKEQNILGNVDFGEPIDPNRLKRDKQDFRYYDTGDTMLKIKENLEDPKIPFIMPDDEEPLFTEAEIREIINNHIRDPRSDYSSNNWRTFQNLLESVGQTKYYDNLSVDQKRVIAENMAHKFHKKFYNRNGTKIIMPPSDHRKQLISFGVRNNLIYKPSDTSRQEKDRKLRSEEEFINAMLEVI